MNVNLWLILILSNNIYSRVLTINKFKGIKTTLYDKIKLLFYKKQYCVLVCEFNDINDYVFEFKAISSQIILS